MPSRPTWSTTITMSHGRSIMRDSALALESGTGTSLSSPPHCPHRLKRESCSVRQFGQTIVGADEEVTLLQSVNAASAPSHQLRVGPLLALGVLHRNSFPGVAGALGK